MFGSSEDEVVYGDEAKLVEVSGGRHRLITQAVMKNSQKKSRKEEKKGKKGRE